MGQLVTYHNGLNRLNRAFSLYIYFICRNINSSHVKAIFLHYNLTLRSLNNDLVYTLGLIHMYNIINKNIIGVKILPAIVTLNKCCACSQDVQRTPSNTQTCQPTRPSRFRRAVPRFLSRCPALFLVMKSPAILYEHRKQCAKFMHKFMLNLCTKSKCGARGTSTQHEDNRMRFRNFRCIAGYHFHQNVGPMLIVIISRRSPVFWNPIYFQHCIPPFYTFCRNCPSKNSHGWPV